MHRILRIIAALAITGLLLKYPSGFLLLFPGIALLPFREKGEDGPAFGVLVVFTSLAFWIITFWWLAYLPTGLNLWLAGGIGGGVFFLVRSQRRTRQNESMESPLSQGTSRGSVVVWSVFLLVAIAYGVRLWDQLTLPCDLSMNAYNARLILEHNGYSTTHQPIWNAEGFGRYPLGFPTLSALASQITSWWGGALPAWRSSAYVGVFAYWALLAASYYLFRFWASPVPAILGAILASFIPNSPHFLLRFGANLNILAFALSVLGLGLFWELPHPGRWGRKALFAGFHAASFLTHALPTIALIYILGPWAIYRFFRLSKEKKTTALKSVVFALAIAAAGVLPYLGKVSISVGPFEMYKVAGWQFFQGTGEVCYKIGAVEGLHRFITAHEGMAGLVMLAFGLGWAVWKERRFGLVLLWSTFAIAGLLANSLVWFLPLSFVLLPDRVVCLFALPLGAVWSSLLERIRRRVPDAASWALTAGFVLLFGMSIWSGYYRNYWVSVREFSALTEADLKAFDWIDAHTPSGTVFFNNQFDAGVWLPTAALRPIALPFVNIILLEELHNSINDRNIEYLYLGARLVHTNSQLRMWQVRGWGPNIFLPKQPIWKEVYGQNGAYVFHAEPASAVTAREGEEVFNTGALRTTFPLNGSDSPYPLRLRWDGPLCDQYNVQMAREPSFMPGVIIYQSYPLTPITQPQFDYRQIQPPPSYLHGKILPFPIYVRVQGAKVQGNLRDGPILQSKPLKLMVR